MPQKYRLTRSDFLEIQRKSARREHGSFFILSVTRNTLTHPRIGIVVSKKVAARAVDRNKIDRRAKAVLRATLPSITDPYDFIFLARKGSKEVLMQEMRHDILTLLEKATGKRSSRLG